MADSSSSDDLAQLEGQLASSSPQSGGKSKKKKKKKSQYQNEVLWTVRLESAWRAGKAGALDIFGSLGSPDKPTRVASAIFVLGLIAFFAVLALSADRLWTYQKLRSQLMGQTESGKNIGEFLAKQAEEAKHKFSTLLVGTFTIELKPAEGEAPSAHVLNQAELEIVIEVDTRETRNYVEENLPQVRNQITNLFVALDREELLSREGKRRLKKRILEKLNTWLPSGKVEELYFSKLIVS